MQGFVATTSEYEGEQCLLIYHSKIYSHPPKGPVARCRIFISPKDKQFVVSVLFRKIERSFTETSPLVEIKPLLAKQSPFSAIYKFCPGIDESVYKEQRKVVPFEPKSLCKVEYPVMCIDPSSCEMWFQLGKFVSRKIREEESVLCRKCSHLKCDLVHQFKWTQEESLSRKAVHCHEHNCRTCHQGVRQRKVECSNETKL